MNKNNHKNNNILWNKAFRENLFNTFYYAPSKIDYMKLIYDEISNDSNRSNYVMFLNNSFNNDEKIELMKLGYFFLEIDYHDVDPDDLLTILLSAKHTIIRVSYPVLEVNPGIFQYALEIYEGLYLECLGRGDEFDVRAKLYIPMFEYIHIDTWAYFSQTTFDISLNAHEESDYEEYCDFKKIKYKEPKFQVNATFLGSSGLNKALKDCHIYKFGRLCSKLIIMGCINENDAEILSQMVCETLPKEDILSTDGNLKGFIFNGDREGEDWTYVKANIQL